MDKQLCKCGKVGEISCPHDERCGEDKQLPAEVLRYKAGAVEYYMQHNYRELYGILQNIFHLAENSAKSTRTWYTEKEMFNYLRLKGYSYEIAEELAKDYAANLQGSYQKGLQHSRDATGTECAIKIQEAQQENSALKRSIDTHKRSYDARCADYDQLNIEYESARDLLAQRCKDEEFAALQARCDRYEKALDNIINTNHDNYEKVILKVKGIANEALSGDGENPTSNTSMEDLINFTEWAATLAWFDDGTRLWELMGEGEAIDGQFRFSTKEFYEVFKKEEKEDKQ